MKKLIVLGLCLLLSGCPLFAKKEDPRVVAFEAGKKQVEVDKRVLHTCKDLPPLKDGTDEQLLAQIKAISAEYKECRTWKDELNRIVKDAFNIK